MAEESDDSGEELEFETDSEEETGGVADGVPPRQPTPSADESDDSDDDGCGEGELLKVRGCGL
jgi:hypothetical protein